MIGQSLANFRIVAKIGEGGMGEVYRAEDTKLGREVAIKVLPEAVATDPERLARFEREAKVLASLNHPNIAAIYQVEEAAGTHFLAMELVEGEDLAIKIKRGAIPIDEALEFARQMSAGMEAAHDRGIVHRDFKPANVMVTKEGQVKILDFGLAKSWEPQSGSADLSQSPTLTAQMTQAGMILGTAGYMSPEQARGLETDKRTDIWAFGVVLWEMVTGMQMFGGPTVTDILASVLQADFKWHDLPSDLSRQVRALLARCLERDPKQRLRDIGEARISLERPSTESNDQAQSATDNGNRQRSRFGWPAQALLALLLVGAAVSGWIFRPSPTPKQVRKLDLVAEGIEHNWYLAPTLSPDGQYVAYYSSEGIWVRHLADLTARQVASTSEPPILFWSPDSQSIGFSGEKQLWRVNIDGGHHLALCDLPETGRVVGASWKSSGIIAFASWRGSMYSVSAEGGRPSLLVQIDAETEVDFHFPSWLPNGDLLFIAHRQEGLDASLGGDRPPIAETAALIEIGVFDGRVRHTVEFRVDTEIEHVAYDPKSQLLLHSPVDSTRGIWARPYDLKSRKISGDAFLVAANGASVSLAGNGSLLYMEDATLEGINELVWADRSGRLESVIAQAQPGMAEPTISPDGKRVAVSAIVEGSRDIWVYDLERGTRSRLTFEDSTESGPSWHPSSKRIAYTAIRGILDADIVIRNADGSGRSQILIEGTGIGLWGGTIEIAPDGKSVLYAIDNRGSKMLRVAPLSADGTIGEGVPLLDSGPSLEGSILDAHISPDGKLLAYMSTGSGQTEVFLTRYPSGEGRWQISMDGGRMPRWARNTSELFFISGSGPSARALSAVTVQSTPEVVIGSPTVLFRNTLGVSNSVGALGFDVAPDGSRFALLRPGTGQDLPPRRMILVQNWYEEFRGRQ